MASIPSRISLRATLLVLLSLLQLGLAAAATATATATLQGRIAATDVLGSV